ncbi:energy transducer TonB [Apibacter sp. HY039]|uniref:energy transducer TonB n=1 Tax=Apibacter sp. HY039 TaxID=2501476 RepID=UPI000FEB8A82|nr:energy transducer TonB [Apibacter sp. HY039]
MKNKWLFYIKKRIDIVMIIFLLIVLGLIFFYLKPETENQKKVFNVYRESDNKKVSETLLVPVAKETENRVLSNETKEGKATTSQAKNPDPSPVPSVNDDQIFDKVEVNAEFTKGNVTQYISQFIEYTDRARDNGTQGNILIKFVVEKDGTITNVRVASKKLGDGLDEMVVKAVYKTNKMWKPAKVDGKPVRTNFRLPITFRLPPE